MQLGRTIKLAQSPSAPPGPGQSQFFCTVLRWFPTFLIDRRPRRWCWGGMGVGRHGLLKVNREKMTTEVLLVPNVILFPLKAQVCSWMSKCLSWQRWWPTTSFTWSLHGQDGTCLRSPCSGDYIWAWSPKGTLCENAAVRMEPGGEITSPSVSGTPPAAQVLVTSFKTPHEEFLKAFLPQHPLLSHDCQGQ